MKPINIYSINDINKDYDCLSLLMYKKDFIYVLHYVMNDNNLNIDFLDFMNFLLKIKKVTLKYMNYFKDNLYVNNLDFDFKNLIKNIMETECFSQDITENICLYLLILYLNKDKFNINIYSMLTESELKKITIPSYVYNYKICLDSSDEDGILLISENFVINNTLYENILENLELLDILSENNINMNNIVKKIINIMC